MISWVLGIRPCGAPCSAVSPLEILSLCPLPPTHRHSLTHTLSLKQINIFQKAMGKTITFAMTNFLKKYADSGKSKQRLLLVPVLRWVG